MPAMISYSTRISYLVSTVLLLGTGLVAVIVPIIFLLDSTVRRDAVITPAMNVSMIVLGAFIILTSMIGLFSMINTVKRKTALAVYGWMIGAIIMYEVAFGLYLWFNTLNINGDFNTKWHMFPDALKASFQDVGKCCGYINVTDSPANSVFCPINPVNPNPALLPKGTPGCQGSINSFVGMYLTNIYTIAFGFIFVDVAALLFDAVMVEVRKDQERYDRATEKLVRARYMSHIPM